VSLDDLLRGAAAGRLPERAVAVTLDDGYLDALTTASPILTELGIPATFFVTTDRLDEKHERWWDVLERIFSGERTLPPTLTLRAGGQPTSIATATGPERATALEWVNRLLWPLDQAARAQMLADILEWSGFIGSARDSHRVLTGDEIMTLASRSGHSIGAHTVHHLALSVQAAATKQEEVRDNKATLDALLGRPVEFFAYPYGEADSETACVVRDAGFHGAVTVERGRIARGVNRLMLPRFEITAADRGERFCRRLVEAFEAPAVCVRSI
jgi:peptidoglycan/xylan/chitin deacetylase (PgdA/CDA1 family)